MVFLRGRPKIEGRIIKWFECARAKTAAHKLNCGRPNRNAVLLAFLKYRDASKFDL